MTTKPPPGEGGGWGKDGDGESRLQPYSTATIPETQTRYTDALALLKHEQMLLDVVASWLMGETPDARSPWLQDALDTAVGAWAAISRVRAAVHTEDGEGVRV